MVRKEITGKRDLTFSGWIRTNCKDSKGSGKLTVTDLDFIFRDYGSNKIQLIESKIKKGSMNYGQSKTFEVLDKIIIEGCKKNNIDYKGFHLVRFENFSPEDGKIFWVKNRVGIEEQITKEELIRRLNMDYEN